jgi:hypothetical protein
MSSPRCLKDRFASFGANDGEPPSAWQVSRIMKKIPDHQELDADAKLSTLGLQGHGRKAAQRTRNQTMDSPHSLHNANYLNHLPKLRSSRNG